MGSLMAIERLLDAIVYGERDFGRCHTAQRRPGLMTTDSVEDVTIGKIDLRMLSQDFIVWRIVVPHDSLIGGNRGLRAQDADAQDAPGGGNPPIIDGSEPFGMAARILLGMSRSRLRMIF